MWSPENAVASMGAHFCQKVVEIDAADKLDSSSVRGSIALGQSIQQEGRDTSLISNDPNK